MNDNPKAASTQESIAFHFDFADAGPKDDFLSPVPK